MSLPNPKQTLAEKEQLLADLGRTELVKDVERAYQGLMDLRYKTARNIARERGNRERARSEMSLFLSNVQDITGLSLDSPLFWQIVARTMKLKLLRKQIGEEQEYTPAFMQGWPDEGGSFSDLPSDGDIEDEIKRSGKQ
jgi:hypothetical protein